MKKTNKQFILDAQTIHGDKYDYSLTTYSGAKRKVIIICKEHGEFSQEACSHLQGCGCPKCGVEKSRNSKFHDNIQFGDQARIVHNNKYDYSKFQYINSHTQGIIICPTHGEFFQNANNHLNGKGCKKCANEKLRGERSDNKADFIRKAKEIHGNKYDYSFVKDIFNHHTKVKIKCPKHGNFWQSPNSHLSGRGCLKCGIEMSSEKRGMTTEEFKQKSKKIHNGRYDYSMVRSFDNVSSKVSIICKKHGIFRQAVGSHIYQKTGCPKCKMVVLKNGACCRSFTEAYYYLELLKNKMNFNHDKRYPSCKRQWRYDFYIPIQNKYIEVTGFDGGFRKADPSVYDKYLKNIDEKREFVEDILKADFEFIELTLTRNMIQSVLDNLEI